MRLSALIVLLLVFSVLVWGFAGWLYFTRLRGVPQEKPILNQKEELTPPQSSAQISAVSLSDLKSYDLTSGYDNDAGYMFFYPQTVKVLENGQEAVENSKTVEVTVEEEQNKQTILVFKTIDKPYDPLYKELTGLSIPPQGFERKEGGKRVVIIPSDEKRTISLVLYEMDSKTTLQAELRPGEKYGNLVNLILESLKITL